ncbi:hypothetical protein KM043_017586 [Ampulex compressa]|nr:hypothetical protein KM043_017586 [Ampulex compressa]
MATQLIDVGENVTNSAIMAKMLAGSTSKCATFQTVWNSVDPSRLTVENLQEKLLREEARLNSDSEQLRAFSAMKNSVEKVENEDEKEENDDSDEKVRDELVIQEQPIGGARDLRPRDNLRHPDRYESNVAEYGVPLSHNEAMSSEDASK